MLCVWSVHPDTDRSRQGFLPPANAGVLPKEAPAARHFFRCENNRTKLPKTPQVLKGNTFSRKPDYLSQNALNKRIELMKKIKH